MEIDMRKNTILFVTAFLLLSQNVLFAQRWGKISKDMLGVTVIPELPNAEAVILLDIGENIITTNFALKFKRHRQIKILNEEGKKYAHISISYWHEDTIDRIRAQAFLPNGKKIKLNKKNIFVETDSLWHRKCFLLPGVEIGSIVEYEYEKTSESLVYLEPWYFQNEIYTQLSEISFFIPSAFNYAIYFGNMQPIEPITKSYRTQMAPDFHVYVNTWRLNNVRAIRPNHDFILTNEHPAAIYFQLNTFSSNNIVYKLPVEWENISKTLYHNIVSYSESFW